MSPFIRGSTGQTRQAFEVKIALVLRQGLRRWIGQTRQAAEGKTARVLRQSLSCLLYDRRLSGSFNMVCVDKLLCDFEGESLAHDLSWYLSEFQATPC